MRKTKNTGFGCPHCGATQGIQQTFQIYVHLDVKSFDAGGEPVLDWNTPINLYDPEHVDTEGIEGRDGDFYCSNCGDTFDAPAKTKEAA